ncbi:MAG TPA: methyltransferase domain-containing protein [Candidatus Paceibacterota bacterium]|nr:methyltransferase domain-containing protein [Candidatus Paceibacterota bacterium]
MLFTHPEKNLEAAYLAEGMSVADFGAGVGHHAIAAARRVGPTGSVYAVEIQPDLLSKLRAEAKGEKLENVHSILGDIEKPNGSTLANGSVDRVLMINVLFQLGSKVEALSEAKRVLNKGGQLVLIDWSDSFSQIGPHQDHVVKAAEAISLSEKAGFKLLQQFEAGSHHYGLLFKVI